MMIGQSYMPPLFLRVLQSTVVHETALANMLSQMTVSKKFLLHFKHKEINSYNFLNVGTEKVRVISRENSKTLNSTARKLELIQFSQHEI